MLDKLFATLLSLGAVQTAPAAPIKVETIKTINQVGPANACGNWAVCNATALTHMLGALDTKNVMQLHAEARRVAHELVPKQAYQLASDEIEALAKKAGIICLVLGRYPDGKIAPLIWNGSGDVTSFDKMAAKLSKMLRIPEAAFVLPCICNIGGHWVMLGVVKREGQQPCMVFMDNCNGSDARVQPFVHYLKQIFSL